jgi:predicted aspartyl protease
MRIAKAALALALTASAPAPDVAPPIPSPDTEIIQGRVERDQRMTIPVHIEKSGPYDFVVDTGSQRSVVATSIAARLALKPSRRMRIVDVGGPQMVDTVEADEIGIGSRSYYGLVLPVLEDENLGAQGIVGTDNLQEQRVLIDFVQNRMAVGSPRQLGGNAGYEIVVTARRKAGQLIITQATIDGVRTAVLIDTGAVTSVGNRALQRALDHRNPSQRVTLISVTGHEIVADIGLPRRLTIGDVGIANLVVAYADSPVFPALDLEKRPALMLGMRELRLFKRVAIDFGARKILFDLPALP